VFALKNVVPGFPVLGSLAQPTGQFLAITGGVVALGVLLGAIHLSWDDGGALVKVRKGLGIALTVVGGFLFWVSYDLPREVPVASAAPGDKPLLAWLHEETAAVDKAKTEKRPLMVDFTADWCAACKRMTKETFSDPRVMEKAGHFVAVKIDATDDEDPQVDAVNGKYKVVGLPTLVLYDSTGAERKRFNDFVGADDFLKALDGIN
jgi:thiol:disulfide interchange protein DsbD